MNETIFAIKTLNLRKYTAQLNNKYKNSEQNEMNCVFILHKREI